MNNSVPIDPNSSQHMRSPDARQTTSSVEKNSAFFRDNLTSYASDVYRLDTYAFIRASVNEAITGVKRLLDIGNGGVFDYDTDLVGEIMALDLFFDKLPRSYVPPPRVILKTGSALDIREDPETFDGVLIVMLIHHLVGRTASDSLKNVRRAISEAYRVLSPGGLLVIVESCVPQWFYGFERLVFSAAVPAIERILPHPAALQYPPSLLGQVLREVTGATVEIVKIPVGRWILQFGYRVPTVFTPARPYRFVVRKPVSKSAPGCWLAPECQ
jgi:SAM-dependent methyltransferase